MATWVYIKHVYQLLFLWMQSDSEVQKMHKMKGEGRQGHTIRLHIVSALFSTIPTLEPVLGKEYDTLQSRASVASVLPPSTFPRLPQVLICCQNQEERMISCIDWALTTHAETETGPPDFVARHCYQLLLCLWGALDSVKISHLYMRSIQDNKSEIWV